MATITVRLDDTTRDDLEQLARARGTTVSELLRAAIDGLLGKDVDMPRADVPRSLDMVQRRSMALLHEILAELVHDDEGYHRRQVQVLNEGFTTEYSQEFMAINAELSPSECTLVMDILDMFTVLEASTKELDHNTLADLGERASYSLTFRGFDQNDRQETRLLSYAQYLIETRRWANLADRFTDAHDGGNSHMPTLGIYQRMLPVYRSIVERKKSARGNGFDAYHFDINDLREVLDATRQPRANR